MRLCELSSMVFVLLTRLTMDKCGVNRTLGDASGLDGSLGTLGRCRTLL
jgi:hypothetical protein